MSEAAGLLSTLYGLRPIDETQPQWSIVNYYQEFTATQAQNNSTTFEIPRGKVYFFTSIYCLLKPEAASLPESFRFVLLTTGTVVSTLFGGRIPSVDTTVGESTIFSAKVAGVGVGGLHQYRGIFGFNQAAVSHTVNWGFTAFSFPQGNILV